MNENLPAKYFVGLAVDGKAPDHSTLTTFRERLLKNGRMKVFEEMLEQIVQESLLRGVKFGSIQIIDSVHSIANVNTDKDKSGKIKMAKGHTIQMHNGASSTAAKSKMKKERKKRTERILLWFQGSCEYECRKWNDYQPGGHIRESL